MAWLYPDERCITNRIGFMSELKFEFRFSSFDSSCLVSVVPYDTNDPDDNTYEFLRSMHGIHRRWRVPCGYLCSAAHIAKQLFYYPEDVSKEDIFLMESYVDMIAKVIDDACEQAESKIRELKEKNKEEVDRIRNQHARQMIEANPCKIEQASGVQIATDYLYLMKHANGLVKIGRSRNPKAREKTLQAEDPRLHLFFTGIGCGRFESRLHKIFATARRRGEWFDLQDHQTQWIIAFCEAKTLVTQQLSEESCKA